MPLTPNRDEAASPAAKPAPLCPNCGGYGIRVPARRPGSSMVYRYGIDGVMRGMASAGPVVLATLKK